MLLTNIKLGVSSGLSLVFLEVGRYVDDANLLNEHILLPLLTLFAVISFSVAIKSYKRLKLLKKVETRNKYFRAIESGNISNLRRLIISNPIEASNYISIVTREDLPEWTERTAQRKIFA